MPGQPRLLIDRIQYIALPRGGDDGIVAVILDGLALAERLDELCSDPLWAQPMLQTMSALGVCAAADFHSYHCPAETCTTID